jgi:hypothetical protein
LWVLALAALSFFNPAVNAAQITAERASYTFFAHTTITVAGEFAPGDEARFQRLLDQVPRSDSFFDVNFRSSGGDIPTAIKIGRLIRQRDGRTTAIQCLSACVLAFVGGVSRTVYNLPESGMGVGVHRFYFGDVSPNATRDEIARGRAQVRSMITAYLSEMNVSPELLALMEGTPPERNRYMSEEELDRYSVQGKDPVWDEHETAKNAFQYGTTSAEYRRRDAQADAQCNSRRKNSQFYTIDSACRWAVLYGLPRAEYDRRWSSVERICDRCVRSNDNECALACIRAVMVDGKKSF